MPNEFVDASLRLTVGKVIAIQMKERAENTPPDANSLQHPPSLS